MKEDMFATREGSNLSFSETEKYQLNPVWVSADCDNKELISIWSN